MTKKIDDKPRPTLAIDLKEFEHFLDGVNAPADKKQEYLETIWEIVCDFVALGFNIHPVQQLRQSPTCGKDSEASGITAIKEVNALQLNSKSLVHNFIAHAEKEIEKEQIDA